MLLTFKDQKVDRFQTTSTSEMSNFCDCLIIPSGNKNVFFGLQKKLKLSD